MKKFRYIAASIVAALILSFAAPAVSQGHYIMHSYEAAAAGQNIAYNDCLYRNNPPWSCFTFPLYGPIVTGITEHTWLVQVGWVQATSWGGRNQCYTNTHWSHGVLTQKAVAPGC